MQNTTPDTARDLSIREEQELLKEELRQYLTDVAEHRKLPNEAVAEVLTSLGEELYEIIRENAARKEA